MAEESEEKAILIFKADIIASPSEFILEPSLTACDKKSSKVEWLLRFGNLFSTIYRGETLIYA